MKSILLIVALMIFQDIDYRIIFKDDYDKASEYMLNHEIILESICNKFDNNPAIITSIIFPEAIRYSMIRDYLETNTLELVYVNTGMADFSIGNFQIKPSFAERIEFYAEKNYPKTDSEIRNWFSYKNGLKEHEIRKERMNRLKNTKSQLYYINFFYNYLLNKFPELANKDIEYLIRFASTAYNYNFEASKENIIENMNGKYFPWGVNNEKKKFNYADISWFYYKGIVSANKLTN